MFLRFRNIWFDLVSFLLAVSFAGGAVVSVVDYVQGRDESLRSAVFSVVMFSLLSLMYVRLSLQVGKMQRKAHERKKAARDRARPDPPDDVVSL